MNPYRPHRLMAVPPKRHARAEIAKALRTLVAQDADDHMRRSEIGTLRRDLEAIPELLRKAFDECRELLQADLRKHSPDQAGPWNRSRNLAAEVAKASEDDAEHPGWPAGTPGGLGGKFRLHC